jgi:hypothetical protein
MKIKKVFENIDDDICREISYEEYAGYFERDKVKLSNNDIETIKLERNKILDLLFENKKETYYLFSCTVYHSCEDFFQFEVNALEDYLYLVKIELRERLFTYFLCEREGLKDIASRFESKF